MNISSIIAWGDSILKGVVSGGDSKRFEITENDSLSIACRKLNISFINKSVFGSFMTKTRHTQDKSIRAMQGRGEHLPDIGIIESGTNDSDYDWAAVSRDPEGPHKMRCPLEEFMHLMEEAVNTARQNKITPVIMNANPLVGDWWYKNICIGNDEAAIKKFLEKNYSGDIYSLYRNQELFALKAAALARCLGVQFIDMRSEFLAHKNYRKLICLDGVHPNQAGYDFMAKIWEREIPKLHKEF